MQLRTCMVFYATKKRIYLRESRRMVSCCGDGFHLHALLLYYSLFPFGRMGCTLNLVFPFQNDLVGRIIEYGGRMEPSLPSMVSCRLSKADTRISCPIIICSGLLERICAEILTLFTFDSCDILDLQLLFTPLQLLISCPCVSLWPEKFSLERFHGWLHRSIFGNIHAPFRALFPGATTY